MKKIFYILILFPLFSFSQNEEEYLIKNLHSLSNKNPKWKKVEAKISDAEKIKLITPLYFDDSEQYCKGDSITNAEQFLKYYSSVFHFIDIDKDKDIDLVFSGMECAASDVGKVNIYINKDNKLQKIFSEYGKISEICLNRSIIIQRHSFQTTSSHLSSYIAISKDSVNLKAAILRYTYMHKAVATKMVPSKLKAGKTISLKFSKNLFLAAEEKDPFNIAKTKDDVFGIIYNTYTDSSKQKWLFVKFPYMDVMQENTISSFDARKTYILGWIKQPK